MLASLYKTTQEKILEGIKGALKKEQEEIEKENEKTNPKGTKKLSDEKKALQPKLQTATLEKATQEHNLWTVEPIKVGMSAKFNLSEGTSITVKDTPSFKIANKLDYTIAEPNITHKNSKTYTLANDFSVEGKIESKFKTVTATFEPKISLNVKKNIKEETKDFLGLEPKIKVSLENKFENGLGINGSLDLGVKYKWDYLADGLKEAKKDAFTPTVKFIV